MRPKPKPSSSKIIIALDHDDIEQAAAFVDRIGDHATIYKVGFASFMRHHFALIDYLADIGKRIFLDLKINDIGTTVRKTTAAIPTNKNIDFITIAGDPNSVTPALDGLRDNKAQLLFVARQSDDNTMTQSMLAYRIKSAALHGATGYIASGSAIKTISKYEPQSIIVAPAIREYPCAEHRHALTAKEAKEYGADYIVVGRPVTQADDPIAVIQSLATDFAK